MTQKRRKAIVDECERQVESCLYTSTALYIWLRCVRWQQKIYIAFPIIVGGSAGLSLLQAWLPDWGVALLVFIASLIPALVGSLKFEIGVDEISRLAAEFKSLQDRFRRCARITALGDVDDAEVNLAELMDRMDIARSKSITPPDWAFSKAQKKIKAGDYSFTVDR